MAKKRVNRTRKPKAKAKKACSGIFEPALDEWDLDDESQLVFNEEGEPRHGTAWDAAFERLYELKSKREARPKRDTLKAIYSELGSARASSRLRWVQVGDSPRQLKAVLGEPPFPELELERYSSEIEACGRAVVLAWINDDLSFFDDLTRVAKIEFGKHRKKARTIEEVVIEEAVQLWYDGLCNPGREDVKREVERKGIKIRAKDWPAYFERCKLDFLKSRKGPGRPRKPEPLLRMVIEMPKGVFTVHHVTAARAQTMKAQAQAFFEAEHDRDEFSDGPIPPF